MDSRTVPGVFVGMDYKTGAYSIYYPEEHTCKPAARSRVFFYTEAKKGESTEAQQETPTSNGSILGSFVGETIG